MASKAIRHIKYTDTLTMSECKDGYWLYDYDRGMNVAMRAKTQEDAFVEALKYYQKRCAEVEEKKKKLYDSVNDFIESLSDNNEGYMPCDCDDC